jgi:DNA-directed RNA polymerase subunit RPC12/RpoP
MAKILTEKDSRGRKDYFFCTACGRAFRNAEWIKNNYRCPYCTSWQLRLGGSKRVRSHKRPEKASAVNNLREYKKWQYKKKLKKVI